MIGSKIDTVAGAVVMFALGLGLGVALLMAAASPARAQVFQPNLDCEAIHLRCRQQADSVTPGNDPCSAYSRCQSRQMCEYGRCICHRTGGSGDPALAEEAAAMCSAVLRPHGPNSCDRYVKACQAWSDAQHDQPDPPQSTPPQTPAQPQPGMPDVPLPPDQLPRFR